MHPSCTAEHTEQVRKSMFGRGCSQPELHLQPGVRVPTCRVLWTLLLP